MLVTSMPGPAATAAAAPRRPRARSAAPVNTRPPASLSHPLGGPPDRERGVLLEDA